MTASLAYLVILIAVLGHASSEFFSVLTGLEGPIVSVWRFSLGSMGLIIVMIVTARSARLLTPLAQDGPRLIMISLGGVSIAYLAFHISLDYASIVQVGTIVTTIPILVGLANLIINKAPVSLQRMITGIAAITGVALLLTDGYLARLAGDASALIGMGLALVCALFTAIYLVQARPLIEKHGSLAITTITMTIGAIGLWLIVGIVWGFWVNPASIFAMSWAQAWPILTVGFWNTTITQFLWLAGLAAVPDITRGSYLFFLKPVITALLAFFILSQPLTPLQLMAIAVICGAVLFEALWPVRKKTKAP
jgi:drug/metabolite transporter, DME family